MSKERLEAILGSAKNDVNKEFEAQKQKNENCFLSDEHKERFIQLVPASSYFKDKERLAFFYILAGNDDLYKNKKLIYNFDDKSIYLDIDEETGAMSISVLGEAFITTGTKTLIKVMYDLFNETESKLSLIDVINLDANNYKLAMNAINLRRKGHVAIYKQSIV